MTCLEIALRLNYCKKEDFKRLIAESDEIAAMLVGFSKQLWPALPQAGLGSVIWVLCSDEEDITCFSVFDNNSIVEYGECL